MTFSKNKWLNLIIPPTGRFWFLFILLHLGVSSLLGFLLPGYLEDFYQGFSLSFLDWRIASLGILTIFIFEYLNRIFYQFATYKYTQHLLSYVRKDSYSRWIKADKNIKGDEDYPMGEVLARVLSDTEAVRELVTSGSFSIFIDIAFIFFSFLGFIKLDPSVGIWMIFLESFVCVGLFLR